MKTEENTTAIFQVVSSIGSSIQTSYEWNKTDAANRFLVFVRLFGNAEIRNRGNFVPDLDEQEEDEKESNIILEGLN